jgi:uncharacterized protein YegL
MRGEPIAAVKVGLETMVASLRTDPYALETVFLSIITFDSSAKQIVPLTELSMFQIPDIQMPESGPAHLGAALQLLCQKVDAEVRLSTPDRKGDWMPLLFIIIDGTPSDTQVYNQMIPEVKKRHFGNIIVCTAGTKTDTKSLQLLADQGCLLDVADSATSRQFFKWVEESVSDGSKSIGAADSILLPPPPEVHTVI